MWQIQQLTHSTEDKIKHVGLRAGFDKPFHWLSLQQSESEFSLLFDLITAESWPTPLAVVLSLIRADLFITALTTTSPQVLTASHEDLQTGCWEGSKLPIRSRCSDMMSESFSARHILFQTTWLSSHPPEFIYNSHQIKKGGSWNWDTRMVSCCKFT